MAKLTYAELQDVVSDLVTAQKVSNATFSVTRDNLVGLADKIGKIVWLDTIYAVDKLAMFDGEYLEAGKTIEELSIDLQLPEDFDASGSGALSPHYNTARPVFYSYTLGRKVIPTSIPNDNIERAVNNLGEFQGIVAMLTKRLGDSMAVYRYGVKREILARAIEMCETEMNQSGATAVGSITTSTAIGTIIKGDATQIGILVKKYVSGTKDWATSVENGIVVPLHLTEELSMPTDATSGEAFIKAVKKDVEKAKDLNEGNSLNGNSLGATEGLVLIVKQGVMPTIDVDTLAGAFNPQKLDVGIETIVVKDFGSYSGNAFAVLCDKRFMRLHNTYRAVRENLNGQGDFLNLFSHTEDTAYISRNCFVKVYEASVGA